MLPIGTMLHEFEITDLIGTGGFSFVYLATDRLLGRTVALKEYMPLTLATRLSDNSVRTSSEHDRVTFEAGLKSFVNEARLLAQFDHQALLKVYRFWEGNGTAYLTMPYHQGLTLKEAMRQHSVTVTEDWLRKILVPITDALEVLHNAHCYHRDISPDNILLLPNGMPLLLDFGAARHIIVDRTQDVTVILKPGYAPIEQYADDSVLRQGPWTDVYALAAVAYFCMAGKAPPASVARTVKDSLLRLASIVDHGFSRPFLDAIERALAIAPADRPQTVAEFRALLQAPVYADTATQPDDPATAPATDVARSAPHPLLLGQPQTTPDRAPLVGQPEQGTRTAEMPGQAAGTHGAAAANGKCEDAAVPSRIARTPKVTSVSGTPRSVGPARHLLTRAATVVGAAILVFVGYWLSADFFRRDGPASTGQIIGPSESSPAGTDRSSKSAALAEHARRAEDARLGSDALLAEEAVVANEGRPVEHAQIAQQAAKAQELRRSQEVKTVESARGAPRIKSVPPGPTVVERRTPPGVDEVDRPATSDYHASLSAAGAGEKDLSSLQALNVRLDSEIRIKDNMIRQMQARNVNEETTTEAARLMRQERDLEIQIARVEIDLLQHERNTNSAIMNRLAVGATGALPDASRREAEVKARRDTIDRLRAERERIRLQRAQTAGQQDTK